MNLDAAKQTNKQKKEITKIFCKNNQDEQPGSTTSGSPDFNSDVVAPTHKIDGD